MGFYLYFFIVLVGQESNDQQSLSELCIAIQCFGNEKKILKEECVRGHSKVCQSEGNHLLEYQFHILS